MNDQVFGENHFNDEAGNPAGGHTSGTGLSIDWQNGPLSVDGYKKEPNGTFVETVIRAAIGRLEYYQSSKFKSEYNERALHLLHQALGELASRTADRMSRGVEGTHNK